MFLVCVSLQGVHAGEVVGDAVHDDCAIETTSSEQFAVGTKDHHTYNFLVILQSLCTPPPPHSLLLDLHFVITKPDAIIAKLGGKATLQT